MLMKRIAPLFLFFLSSLFAQNITISNLPSFAGARYHHEGVVLNDGRLLIIGGQRNPTDYESINTCNIFNPITNSWTTVAPMNQARTRFSALLLPDGRVLVMGGLYRTTTAYEMLNSCEIYDPTNNTWTYVASMNNVRYGHQASLIRNGKIMVCGGGNPEGSTEVYDIYNNTWEVVGDLNSNRQFFNLVKLNNNLLFAIGGDQNSSGVSTIEKFNQFNYVWEQVDEMVGLRGYSATEVVNNNTAITIGGSNQTTAEKFILQSSVSHEINSIASPQTNKYDSKAIRMSDGRILIYGLGEIFNLGDTKAFEIYDPNSDSWISPITNYIGTQGYAINKLNNGDVIITGGASLVEETNDVKKVAVNFPSSCDLEGNTFFEIQQDSLCFGKEAYVYIHNSQPGVFYEAYVANNLSSNFAAEGDGGTVSLSLGLSQKGIIGDNYIKISAKSTDCGEIIFDTTLIVNLFLNNDDTPEIIFNDTTYCHNETVSLSATPNVMFISYIWSHISSGGVNTTATSSQPFISLYTNRNSCKSINSPMVTLNFLPPNPSVEAGPNFQVCPGQDSIILSGFSPPGGTWSGPGIIDASGIFSAAALAPSQTYTINYNYCSINRTRQVDFFSSDTIYISQIRVNNIALNSPEFYFCNWSNNSLRVTKTGNASLDVFANGNLIATHPQNTDFTTHNVITSIPPNVSTIVTLRLFDNCDNEIWDTLTIKKDIYNTNYVDFDYILKCFGDSSEVRIFNSDTTTYYYITQGSFTRTDTIQGNGDTLIFKIYSFHPNFNNFSYSIKATNSTFTCETPVSNNFSLGYMDPYNAYIGNGRTFFSSEEDIEITYNSPNQGQFFTWELNGQIIDTVYNVSSAVPYYFPGSLAQIGSNTIGLNAHNNMGCIHSDTLNFEVIETNLLSNSSTVEELCSFTKLPLATASAPQPSIISAMDVNENGYKLIAGSTVNSCAFTGWGNRMNLLVYDNQDSLIWSHTSNNSNLCGYYVSSAKLDKNNNIYLAGNFGSISSSARVNFLDTTLFSAGNRGFLAKIDSAFNLKWIKFSSDYSNPQNTFYKFNAVTDIMLLSDSSILTSITFPYNNPEFGFNNSNTRLGLVEINSNTGAVLRKWQTENGINHLLGQGSMAYSSSVITPGSVFMYAPSLINLGCGKIGVYGKMSSWDNSTPVSFDNIDLTATNGNFLSIIDINNENQEWDDAFLFESINSTPILNQYSIHANNRKDKLIFHDEHFYYFRDNYLITKFDSNGNYLWHREFSPANFTSIYIANDVINLVGSASKYFGIIENNIISGFTTNEENDFFHVKLDLDGNLILLNSYGSDYEYEVAFQSFYDKCKNELLLVSNVGDGANLYNSQINFQQDSISRVLLRISLDGQCNNTNTCVNQNTIISTVHNFPSNKGYCNEDTLFFTPNILTPYNYNVEYYYETDLGFLSLENNSPPFEYYIDGSNLKIWNIEGVQHKLKLEVSVDDPEHCITNITRHCEINKNPIQGEVYASDSITKINGIVELYDLDTTNSVLNLLETLNTFLNISFFEFSENAENPILKVTPNSTYHPNQIPTYYNMTPVVQDASLLCSADTTKVYTLLLQSLGGDGSINGSVGEGGGKSGNIGTPVSDLTIVLIRNESEILDHKKTNSIGNFTFENLPIGEYSIWVDMLGVDNALCPKITIEPNNMQHSDLYILHPNRLQKIEETNEEEEIETSINSLFSNNVKIYPNPTDQQLTIDLTDLSFSKLEKNISIYNLLGESIIDKNDNNNLILLNLNEYHISSGVYYIKIKAGNQVFIDKFTYSNSKN